LNVRRWAPPLAWAATIFLLTSIPSPQLSAPRGSDKVAHALVYGILGALTARSLLAAPRRRSAWIAAALGLITYGALDEFHQRFIPGRFADVGDWAADSAGAVAGLTLMAAFARRAHATTPAT
jgi:VanZ family protein